MTWPRFTAALALAGSLAACGGGGADPDRVVDNGGIFVDGWTARFDRADAKPTDVRFTALDDGSGYRATVGPNVVLWDSTRPKATGSYRLEVEVKHLETHGHHHGAGLVFGANDLEDEAQTYTYFLVHGGGKLLIKRRDGTETSVIVPYTAHDAVARLGSDGTSTNRLAVVVDADATAFYVNDVEVHAAPNSELYTAGHYGLRAVHNLDLEFRGLRQQPRP